METHNFHVLDGRQESFDIRLLLDEHLVDDAAEIFLSCTHKVLARLVKQLLADSIKPALQKALPDGRRNRCFTLLTLCIVSGLTCS